MTEQEFQEMLQSMIEDMTDLVNSSDAEHNGFYGYESLESSRTATFREHGLLTNNSGLVVKLADGSEFQITIVRSK